MSIIRVSDESEFYIYASDEGYEMWMARDEDKHSVRHFHATKAELRAEVERLIGLGFRAPADLLAWIDGYSEEDGYTDSKAPGKDADLDMLLRSV